MIVSEFCDSYDQPTDRCCILIGEHKGIEGAHNSCYMDSLLFSMFYTSQVFDFLLFKAPNDTKYMKKTRRLLKNIVRSLRQVYYCNYETVWSLREHLGSKNEDLLGAFMGTKYYYSPCYFVIFIYNFPTPNLQMQSKFYTCYAMRYLRNTNLFSMLEWTMMDGVT